VGGVGPPPPPPPPPTSSIVYGDSQKPLDFAERLLYSLALLRIILLMRSKIRWGAIILRVLVFVGLAWGYGLAQEEGRFFPETGHSVKDQFLVKYESIPNNLTVYGPPITEMFWDKKIDRWVQYFERAHFVLEPNQPHELQVQITLIGEIIYPDEASTPLPVPPNSPACEYFPQTGHRVCYAFLDFFLDNGGVAQFGHPISDFEIHDGWITQYFQRARFEWHPERSEGHRVTLTNLGRRYFQRNKEDPARLRAVLTGNIPQQPVLELQVQAFVVDPVISRDDSQTLYVIVQDQYLNPVGGATVSVKLNLPGEIQRDFTMIDTNDMGISKFVFPIDSELVGRAQITVQVSQDPLDGQTRTSFQVWW
jgi:hypothetical protein